MAAAADSADGMPASGSGRALAFASSATVCLLAAGCLAITLFGRPRGPAITLDLAAAPAVENAAPVPTRQAMPAPSSGPITKPLYAGKALDGLTGGNDDQTRGIDIVRKALQAPVRQIAENAGVDGAVVAGKLIDGNDEKLGFNAQTETYEDVAKAGVIDPTKVVRAALQDAASVAGLLITTEAAVSELPEDKPAMPAMPGGGMGGMDF